MTVFTLGAGVGSRLIRAAPGTIPGTPLVVVVVVVVVDDDAVAVSVVVVSQVASNSDAAGVDGIGGITLGC